MNYNCGIEVTEEEARAVASFLEEKILPSIKPGERIMLDGTITNIPDGGIFYREPSEQFKNYSAREEWLRLFANFCQKCNGFKIY
jgi:hypothetical protein